MFHDEENEGLLVVNDKHDIGKALRDFSLAMIPAER